MTKAELIEIAEMMVEYAERCELAGLVRRADNVHWGGRLKVRCRAAGAGIGLDRLEG
jgi:hypothetical protein